MYHETLKDRLFNVWLWLRHVGWIIAVGILILAPIIYGMYALAISKPVVKLSTTLGVILAYNLLSRIAAMTPGIKDGQKEKLGKVLGCFVLLLIPIAVYSLILSAFVVPWFLTALIFLSFLLAIVLVVFDEKRIVIPRYVFWIRNMTTILSFSGLAYYLARYLSWF